MTINPDDLPEETKRHLEEGEAHIEAGGELHRLEDVVPTPSEETIRRLDDVENVEDEPTPAPEEETDPEEKAKAIIVDLPDPDPKVLVELAVAACTQAPFPWLASNGRLYWDDGEPEPWDRAETIIGRFGSDTRATLLAQYVAQAGTAAAALVRSIYDAHQRAMDSRSAAGRLADAIDNAVDSGGCDTPTANALKKAVTDWEESLQSQGVAVSHGPIPKGAGVSYEPPDV